MSQPINLYIQDADINNFSRDNDKVSAPSVSAGKTAQATPVVKDIDTATTSTLATPIEYTQTQEIGRAHV